MRSRGLDVLVLISAFAVYLVAAIPAVGGAQGPGGSARTVWDGAYSDAQADRGRTQYAGHCAECHGGELQGREASALAGANTRLNVLYDTNQGFGLWDISVVTGVPDTYKIVPNDMTILATTQGRRFRYRRAAGAGGRRARPLASHDV